MKGKDKYRLVKNGRRCHLQELQDTFFGKEYVTCPRSISPVWDA